MEWISNIISIVIALSIYNVWLIRFGKSTPWRGGTAKNMKEEFAAYGLPEWFMYLVGGLKVISATLLVIGIWYPQFSQPSAVIIAVLMSGAIIMHVKIKDPLKRSLPAILFLVLSLFVIFF